MSAALEHAKTVFPSAKIDLLIPESWADLYQGDPRVTQLHTLNTRLSGIKKLWSVLSTAWKFLQLRYDLILLFHSNPSGRWISFLSLPKMLVAHNHAFFKSDWPSHVKIPEKNILKPAIDRDLSLYTAINLGTRTKTPTTLYVDIADKQWAEKEILNRGLLKPLLFISPGASRVTKCWPIENFAQIAISWVERLKGSVLLVSGPEEESLNQVFLNITKSQGQTIQSLHSPSLKLLKALFSCGQLFLGNDSGPKHLAAAVGLPTVTIFGPEDPYEYHPYDTSIHSYLRIPNLDCRKNLSPQGNHPWCGIPVCVEQKHKCMRDIGVATVFDALIARLR